jgi:hypothetical protein
LLRIEFSLRKVVLAALKLDSAGTRDQLCRQMRHCDSAGAVEQAYRQQKGSVFPQPKGRR